MCGIAGIWGDASVDRLRAMGNALRHRGPDDQGLWHAPDEPFGFAHRRLSIIDIDGGHQPVFNESGRIATIFNGEIYNYKELRAELLARGHKFVTQTDTECIVHLYEESGTDFVQKLRGMFAIAVWDGDARRLVLARDRVGKKPLYYSEAAGEFLFASEIKGLVAALACPPDIDDQALADYLTWGEILAPATIYGQIRSLEPAELMVVEDRRIAQRGRYWTLRLVPKSHVSVADAVEQVDGLLRESVRLRLRSDVPVGCFLSGGIDSGIITAMAAQENPGGITTVTIGFEDDSFDERPLARLVAQRYGTDHHEVLVRPDVRNDLIAIAAAYDQPYADSSAIPAFYTAKAARQFVKVVLNGDGGDELFAGYRRYVAARINTWLSWTDNAALRPVWRALAGVLPTPGRYRSNYAFMHRLIRGMAAAPQQRYMAWSVDVLTEEEKRGLGGRNGNGWLARHEAGERLVAGCLHEYAACGALDRMMAADYLLILPNDLLVKMDIACMAHSLEGRSPLLDHVLTETVARYPESVKLAGLQTKPVLRRLAARYLPAEICSAPKRGFEVPLVRWLQGELRDLCHDVVLARSGLLAERCDRAALERLVRGEENVDAARWARRTWTLLMLGLWDANVRARCQPATIPA